MSSEVFGVKLNESGFHQIYLTKDLKRVLPFKFHYALWGVKSGVLVIFTNGLSYQAILEALTPIYEEVKRRASGESEEDKEYSKSITKERMALDMIREEFGEDVAEKFWKVLEEEKKP